MREYGKKMILSLAALLLCVMRPFQVMAATTAGVATGDETPIIALILCIAGVAIIVVAVKKRK